MRKAMMIGAWLPAGLTLILACLVHPAPARADGDRRCISDSRPVTSALVCQLASSASPEDRARTDISFGAYCFLGQAGGDGPYGPVGPLEFDRCFRDFATVVVISDSTDGIDPHRSPEQICRDAGTVFAGRYNTVVLDHLKSSERTRCASSEHWDEAHHALGRLLYESGREIGDFYQIGLEDQPAVGAAWMFLLWAPTVEPVLMSKVCAALAASGIPEGTRVGFRTGVENSLLFDNKPAEIAVRCHGTDPIVVGTPG